MRYIVCALTAALILSACGGDSGNQRFDSFYQVKDILLHQIYYDHHQSFYCGCSFNKHKKVGCKTGSGKRAERIEWEHVVPASVFGRTFDEWERQKSWGCLVPKWLRWLPFIRCKRTSARAHARQHSEAFRRMEADMYNLVPAIGLINGRRANYPFRMIPGERRAFGGCDFEVADQCAEPAPHIRGDIARIYFYMEAAYPGRDILEGQDRRLLSQWDKADPVDAWECERCKRIENIQGNPNPILRQACQEAGLW